MTCSLLAGSHLNLRRRFAHASKGFLTDQSAKVSIDENKMADESAWGVRVQCGKIQLNLGYCRELVPFMGSET